MNIGDVLCLALVGLIWGSTNILINKGSHGIEAVQHSNFILKFFAELKFLLFNWRYVVPSIVNSLGSMLYYYKLGTADVSLASPLANGLTFVFTAAAGWWTGEIPASWRTWAGMGCVLIGVALCVFDKM